MAREYRVLSRGNVITNPGTTRRDAQHLVNLWAYNGRTVDVEMFDSKSRRWVRVEITPKSDRNRSGRTRRNRSGNAADHRKFIAIKTKWFELRRKQEEYESMLFHRYGKHNPPSNWLSAVDKKKADAIRDQMNKTSHRMHELLERVSPRDWSRGIAAHWIMDNLSWEDAITTGPLSMIPHASYGTTQAEVDRFARAIQ